MAIKDVNELSTVINEGRAYLKLATDLLYQTDRGRIRNELESIYTSLEASLLPGRPFPPEKKDGLRLLRDDPEHVPDLLQATGSLVNDIVVRLSLGPVQHHVINRACAYLAHFGKEALIERLQAHKGQAKNEAIIQSVLDAFIFGEGLYPITHADAAGGKIDTFIERTSILRKEAERHIPVLIELKQLVKLDGNDNRKRETVEKEIKDLAALAVAQAKEYKKHLQTRWPGHEVFSLVVYDGPYRFDYAPPGVRLVYLGPTKPSGVLPLTAVPELPSPNDLPGQQPPLPTDVGQVPQE